MLLDAGGSCLRSGRRCVPTGKGSRYETALWRHQVAAGVVDTETGPMGQQILWTVEQPSVDHGGLMLGVMFR